MLIKKRISWAVLIAIATLLVLGGTVLAEGEVPPEEPAPAPAAAADEPAPAREALRSEEPALPVEGSAPAPIAAAEEPVPAGESLPPEESALLVEESTPAEAPAIEAAAPEAATGETSVDGLNLTAVGDPWWMVGLQKYAVVSAAPNCPSGTSLAGNTCWVNIDPITDALARISNGLLPTDRKLYVEAGTYDDAIILNGNDGMLGQMKGLIGPDSVEGSFTAFLTGDLDIYNIVSGFTLSGFDMTTYRAFIRDSIGTVTLKDLYIHGSAFGLQVENHNGAIVIDQVRVEESLRRGLYLNNQDSPTAGITITNSSFDLNNRDKLSDSYSGMELHTNGPVVINGISSSHNHGDGLSIEGASSVSIKNSVFSYNDDISNLGDYGWGLHIYAERPTPVTLEHVYANYNEHYGVEVSVGGKITASNVIASDNMGGGAYLDNCGYDSGTLQCNNTLFTPVLVSNSYFHYNTGGKGLEIRSKAAVTLSSVRADYNNIDYGVYINNCNWDLGACQGSGSVLVTSNLAAGEGGLNYFGHNGHDGLYIFSKGAVTLNNFTAEFNGLGGVTIDNDQTGAVGGVTVKSTLAGWENICRYNSTEGLDVDSNGTILVDRINCIGNHAVGIDLFNMHDPFIKNITLSNAESDQNYYGGIQVHTHGNITIINVTADYNDNPGDSWAYYHGMALDNAGGTGNVVIKSTSTSVFYEFGYNSGYGIELLTNGTAAVSNVNAIENVDDGFRIGGANDPKSLIMTRCTADNNDKNGINAQVDGSALLTNVSASGNGWNGIYLFTGGAVTLKTSSTLAMNELYNNGNSGSYDGLNVSANGAVTIQNTDAYSNTLHGMTLWNSPAYLYPVKILRSSADYNTSGGYYINTNGVVTVTDSSAVFNDSYGLNVDTDSAVTVNCTGPAEVCSFSHNHGDGLNIRSKKSIIITKVVANTNTDDGMELRSYFTPSPILITKVSAGGNNNNGIYAFTEATLTINTIIARANSVAGVSFGTLSGEHGNNVVMLGTNLFESNGSGTIIYATGTVSLSGITTQYNTSYGVVVFSYTEGKTIAMNNIVTRYNINDGLYVDTRGSVNLNLVRSIGNYDVVWQGDGLYLKMTGIGDIATISNSVFTGNAGSGIEADIFNPNDYSKFRLINTTWMGNDSYNDGDPNLNIY